MTRKLSFWLLWVGVLAYAFLLAPPDRPDTLTLIQNLSTGKLEGINPAIVALFNVMGIWPMIYACVLFIDGRMQKIWAWPFALGSFAVGAFAILPYLALRNPAPTFTGSKSFWLKPLDSRWTGLLLMLLSIGLLAYGIQAGNWSDFVQQWQTSRFIHVMSLDFCLLSLLFPTLVPDDLTRRNGSDRRLFWLTWLPLLGPALYLSLRPPLPDMAPTITPEASVAS